MSRKHAGALVPVWAIALFVGPAILGLIVALVATVLLTSTVLEVASRDGAAPGITSPSGHVVGWNALANEVTSADVIFGDGLGGSLVEASQQWDTALSLNTRSRPLQLMLANGAIGTILVLSALAWSFIRARPGLATSAVLMATIAVGLRVPGVGAAGLTPAWAIAVAFACGGVNSFSRKIPAEGPSSAWSAVVQDRSSRLAADAT